MNHAETIASEAPLDENAFYSELTLRNRAFIDPETQTRLRALKVLVAGCGSTGGACTQSLARLGVMNFALADNGTYDLTNLNRQHAYVSDIGRNKAAFNGEQLARINPFARIKVHVNGVTPGNVIELVSSADLVLDAVDVTTPSGMQMKLLLHEVAQRLRKPALTALDMGFCQWGRAYDYRDPSLQPLGGKLAAARESRHPLKALFSIVPLSAVPDHCLQLLKDLLLDGSQPASQLGCASDLLSAIIAPVAVQFAATGTLPDGWSVDLAYLTTPARGRWTSKVRSAPLRARIARLLKRTP